MSGCVKFWTTRHCNQNKRHFNRVEQLQVKVLIAKTCGSCSCHEPCCSSVVLTFSTQVWHTHRSRNTFFFVHFSYCCSILFVCHFWLMMDTQTYVCPHTHTELLSPGTILIDACTAVSKQFVPLLPTEWEDECLPSLLYHEPPLLSLSHLSVSPPLYFLLFLWSFLSTALSMLVPWAEPHPRLLLVIVLNSH